MHSIRRFSEGEHFVFEAFIEEAAGIFFMPVMEADSSGGIIDIHCQCCDDNAPCIHKSVLLLAAKCMFEAECDDYHMAQKVFTSKIMSGIIFKRVDAGDTEERYV